MSKGHLHEEQGQADEQEAEEVGDEKSSASIGVADVGEPPEVAEADGEAQAGQEELAVVVPLASFRPLGLSLDNLEFFFSDLFRRHFLAAKVFFSSLEVRKKSDK